MQNGFQISTFQLESSCSERDNDILGYSPNIVSSRCFHLLSMPWDIPQNVSSPSNQNTSNTGI